MRIGKYNITSDNLNVTVTEVKTVKKDTKNKKVGDEVDSLVGFYSNLKQALLHLRDFHLNKSGMADLQTILKAIDESDKLIQQVSQNATRDTQGKI